MDLSNNNYLEEYVGLDYNYILLIMLCHLGLMIFYGVPLLFQ